ncbi:MAG: GMC family oxidoreductase [Acidiferrobacterales bacterium]
MRYDFDVCVIGSGAGGGPVAFSLANAGYSVVVLEKGPWLTEKDFYKDELACCLRSVYTSNRRDEPHVVETGDNEEGWHSMTTDKTHWDFWNGNCVGGSTNFMSGFFHRLKPVDFRLLSTFGPIEDANVVDWPISYDDLEPYYDKVEKEVGVSGRVVAHPFAEPRSHKNFPYPPTQEHPVAGWFDKACRRMGLHSVPTPRAILPHPVGKRNGCNYSGYCGAYGCSTGAKGSSRAALLDHAALTGRCKIKPHSKVSRLVTNKKGHLVAVEYFDKYDVKRKLDARIYVVACQAVETSRLLLLSRGPKFENGLANNSGQVGRNLIFAGGGSGSGRFVYSRFSKNKASELHQFGPFLNRSLQDWYVINDKEFGPKQKGGTIDFVNMHPNPVVRSTRQIREGGRLLWGKPLKRKLERHFKDGKYIKIEAFCDWLPNADCHVTLDPKVKDKWGLPAARIRVGFHMRNVEVGWYLAAKGAAVLKRMGAENVISFASAAPPTNLQAGGCRFGTDPKHAVLDADCRAYDVENLFVTDGSFMPTGGSVPHTWTIYANSFRVADRIIQQLGGVKQL